LHKEQTPPDASPNSRGGNKNDFPPYQGGIKGGEKCELTNSEKQLLTNKFAPVKKITFPTFPTFPTLKWSKKRAPTHQPPFLTWGVSKLA
jgi:hypothetical protein